MNEDIEKARRIDFKCGKCGSRIRSTSELRQNRCLDCLKLVKIKFLGKNPWIESLYHARQRCSNSNHIGYKRYGGKGIKVLLSPEEVRFLWVRDKARNMVHPTIDRVNPDGHYEINNCRFLEQKENAGRRRNPGKDLWAE